MRPTAKRVGDIAVLLAVVAALTLIGALWLAFDAGDGLDGTFWSFASGAAGQSLLFAFPAAALTAWMDDDRRGLVTPPLLVILVLTMITTIGGAADVASGSEDGASQLVSSYLFYLGYATLALGAIALIRGWVPDFVRRLGREEADPE